MQPRSTALPVVLAATLLVATWLPPLPAFAHGAVVVITLFFIAFGVVPAAAVAIIAGLKLLPRRRHAVFVGVQCGTAGLAVAVMTLLPLDDELPWIHLLALATVGLPLAGMLWLENKPREALVALVASVIGVPVATLGLFFLLTGW